MSPSFATISNYSRFISASIVDGQINGDEGEVEDVDVRAEYPCPYCHEEFDASALCVHLENEHCPKSKVLMHRRRKFKRGGAPSTAPIATLGKELCEANIGDLIEGNSQIGGLLANPIDPLLATLVYNVPITDLINVPIATSNVIEKIVPTQAPPCLHQQLNPNVGTLLTLEERKQKQKEAEVRAKFVQELVLSTLVSKM